MEPVLDSLWAVLGGCVIIIAINYGMGVFGPVLGEWAAHRQPSAPLRTLKNSLGLLGWARNGSCVL